MQTIKEFVKILNGKGKYCSVKYLTYLCYKGKLPAKKVGRMWFIDEKESVKYLSKCRKIK
jgi:hypothetical protein